MSETNLFEEVDLYINRLLAREDDALQEVLRSIDRENIPWISISAGQGKMLQVFAKMCGARRILELGTLAGYSTIWLARALPEDGKLISLEYDPHHALVARKNIEYAGLSSKVEIRTGKALDLLPEIETENEGPFDLIFIDADKPPYLEYFQWAVKLSRQGSIIICDNVIRNGAVLDPESTDEKVQGVQRLNEYLATCKEVTAIILPTIGIKEFDGMVISVVN